MHIYLRAASDKIHLCCKGELWLKGISPVLKVQIYLPESSIILAPECLAPVALLSAFNDAMPVRSFAIALWIVCHLLPCDLQL